MDSHAIQDGVVENFSTATKYPPGWYELKIKGKDAATLVHHNRIRELGELKPGDKVRFQISKVRPYDDDATYLTKLEKVPQEGDDVAL